MTSAVCFSLLVAAVALLLWKKVLVFGSSEPKCPSCQRYDQRNFSAKTMTNKEKGYGLVTRTGTTQSYGQMAGQSTPEQYNPARPFYSRKESAWKERVPVIRTTFRFDYKCVFCGREWSITEVEEVEDFS